MIAAVVGGRPGARVNRALGQAPGALESTNVTVGAASQASATVGAGKVGVAGHSMVCGSAQVMLGAVVSTTVMFWLQLA